MRQRLEGTASSSIWNDDGLGVPLDEARKTHRRVLSKIEQALERENTPTQEPEELIELTEVEATVTSAPTTLLWSAVVEADEAETAKRKKVYRRIARKTRPAVRAKQKTEEIKKLPRRKRIPVQPELKETPAPTPKKAAAEKPKPAAKKKTATRVKYPIQFKLITIVTVLLVVSLGTITALVSVLVSSDVQLTAEVNNFSINRRNAESMNNQLRNIRSIVASFLNDIAIIDARGLSSSDSLAGMFFQQNSEINCIILSPEAGETNIMLPSQSRVSREAIQTWIASESEILERARYGETLLRNASTYFSLPQITMLLPVSISLNGNTSASYCAAVFFSQDNIARMLSSGSNSSFLLNDDADVLIHEDESLILGGANFSRIPFIENALSAAGRGTQTIYTDDKGVEYFGVYQRLAVGNALLVTIIKRSEVFQGIVDTTRRNIIISVIVLVLSLFFISIFARSLSRPIQALTVAARKIEKGDYNLGLTHKSNDEIGALTKSFIGMGLGLENFEKFTNKAIVKLARRGKLTRGGVNRKITVCFLLIRDFSELSHNMNASQIVGFVNEYLELMVPCITITGGVVDKFLTQGGVIIMAVWGSPDTAGTPAKDALNCLRSMLMVRASLVDFNQELQKRFWGYAPLIKIGCGINSGEVVAGQMGSESRMEYTVIGDAVNLAARLEGANDVFDTDILISENTWDLVKQKVMVQEMPNIEVKGKVKPLRVFSVVNMKTLKAASILIEKLGKIHKENIAKDVRRYWATTMEEVRYLWRNALINNNLL
ncbi:MAG: HAMP domain-containing protein [Spirochaetaceae bacterium]|nr:HAMP domain-containing protein [Spirochaetaceae bacterium]